MEESQSAGVLSCTAQSLVSSSGVTLSRTTGNQCPRWTVSGFAYNAAIVKQNTEIRDSMRMNRYRRVYGCKDNRYLFGLFGSIDCVIKEAAIFETQIHVLMEGPCRAEAPVGHPEVDPGIGGVDAP